MAGTTDLTKLQEDVVFQCKSGKGHLNITVNEVQVPEEIISKPERSAPDKSPDKLSDQGNHPPLEKAVEQKADDTKESLFSDHTDHPQESDYFAIENESDEDQGSASLVFRVNNNNAYVDTSNEIIGPTQVDTHPNPISTLGLVEVEALSSPIVPSGQPQCEENVDSTEHSNGHDSAQNDDENTDVPEEGVDDSINFPADDSSITNDDPFPFKKDITSHPFPEYNIPHNEQQVDNTSIDSGIHSSSSVLHEHDCGVDGNEHEHDCGVDGNEHEHGVYGIEHEEVGGQDNIVNEDVIYNQEVITLNCNMDVKKNLGSDCVLQAQGETKLVVSVQSNVEKNEIGPEVV